MKYKFRRLVIVALGGSVVCPDAIDSRFIREFKKFVEKNIKRGKRFLLVVGGGRICREYQDAASRVAPLADEDKDWLGIHVSRLNAHLIRTVFRKIANPIVIDARHKVKKLTRPVTVAGGWRPGWSTDYVATALAYDFGAREVIVAGKPDYVYDRDPHKGKGAKSFRTLTWTRYQRLIPGKWTPGFHSPVDPVAARLAQKKKLKAIVVDGRNLKNFENLLSGKSFRGTVIG
ncbi:UMP kinase [Candidatus Parcubacteria bacterium]|nr:MAG: UMP kinase [Candidatus Parcubacteria bacterium]